jgi:hypothetical protein
MTMKKFVVLLLVLYVGGYLAFRQTNTQVWERDKQSYIIFPQGNGVAFYYLWRPLSYLDNALTGTRAHIGPHR